MYNVIQNAILQLRFIHLLNVKSDPLRLIFLRIYVIEVAFL